MYKTTRKRRTRGSRSKSSRRHKRFNTKTGLVSYFHKLGGGVRKVANVDRLNRLTKIADMPSTLKEAAAGGATNDQGRFVHHSVYVPRIRVILEANSLLTPAGETPNTLPLDQFVIPNDRITHIEIPINEWIQHTGLNTEDTIQIQRNIEHGNEDESMVDSRDIFKYDRGTEMVILKDYHRSSDRHEAWAVLKPL